MAFRFGRLGIYVFKVSYIHLNQTGVRQVINIKYLHVAANICRLAPAHAADSGPAHAADPGIAEMLPEDQ